MSVLVWYELFRSSSAKALRCWIGGLLNSVLQGGKLLVPMSYWQSWDYYPALDSVWDLFNRLKS